MISSSVLNTHGVTTINTGDGNDSLTVTTTSSPSGITMGNGTDSVSILGTGATTNVATGNGVDTITLQSTGRGDESHHRHGDRQRSPSAAFRRHWAACWIISTAH